MKGTKLYALYFLFVCNESDIVYSYFLTKSRHNFNIQIQRKKETPIGDILGEIGKEKTPMGDILGEIVHHCLNMRHKAGPLYPYLTTFQVINSANRRCHCSTWFTVFNMWVVHAPTSQVIVLFHNSSVQAILRIIRLILGDQSPRPLAGLPIKVRLKL